MQSLKVCVIGDTIVDEYIQCDPWGMSQEDPTIVVTPIMTERFLGGAAIVAAHARNLGAESAVFISITGDDDTGGMLLKKLDSYGVTARLLKDDSRPTTLKQRYRAGSKTLLRVSHLRQHKINKELQAQAFDHVKQTIADADLLIFADFNYGALPQKLVDAVSNECRQRDVMIVADSHVHRRLGMFPASKSGTSHADGARG